MVNLSQLRPRIVSCFATATKFGIWVPDQRVFEISKRAENLIAEDLIMECPIRDLITGYLMHVGTMLQDENFSEAKQCAKNSKAAFDEVYAEFGL